MLLQAGTPELVRNVDLRLELEKFAAAISFAWIEHGEPRAGSGDERYASQPAAQSFAGRVCRIVGRESVSEVVAEFAR